MIRKFSLNWIIYYILIYLILAIMAQSSYRECIKIANGLLDFEKLELYFQGLIKLGNGSSLLALDNVKRFKQNFIDGKDVG